MVPVLKIESVIGLPACNVLDIIHMVSIAAVEIAILPWGLKEASWGRGPLQPHPSTIIWPRGTKFMYPAPSSLCHPES